MLSELESRTSLTAKEHSSILATVLYEDLESGLRARALMGSVEANMDFPAAFQLDLWRFDWLAERSLGNIALSRAERSALVLISAGSLAALPPAAENWLNTWVQMEQNHPLALVVLLPKGRHGEEKSHPLYERLQMAARQKQVDFFCEFFEQPAPSRRISLPASEAEETLAGGAPFEIASPQWESDSTGERKPSHGSARLRPVRTCGAISHAAADPERKQGLELDSFNILNHVTLSDMNPKTRRQSGLPNDCEGVLVACIDSASPAFKAGLRAGDVIQQMDQQDVRAAADALSLGHSAKGKNMLLRVWSQGDSRFLVVNRSAAARGEV
jgi:hypothetical protein